MIHGPRAPLCFVVMPFGVKPDSSGGSIDFDAVYHDIIEPGIRQAGMEPIRADDEASGGVIHKAMYERLILCDYAVADLTTANANVFYELGVRHAIRPQTTVAMYWRGGRLPFDVAQLRAVAYSLESGTPASAGADSAALAAALGAARSDATDSPVFQLVSDLAPADISRLKTDVFRDRVEYANDVKQQLTKARSEGVESVEAVLAELGEPGNLELGVAIDVFLSFRAVKAWERMVEFVAAMPEPIARSVMVREQLALALNRLERGEEAEQILLAVIEERGASSETYGLLGRVYKDRWQRHKDDENQLLAIGSLKEAIDAYLKGFEADWRDAYPGINAVTLMEFTDPPDPRQAELLPVVRYAAMRRVATGQPDYWDHATLLELAVIASDETAAMRHGADALAMIREVWEPETTLRNLRLIRDVRQVRGEPIEWFGPIETALAGRAQESDG